MDNIPATPLVPFIFTIQQACTVACASRSTLYQSIAKGELRALKRGKRTLILASDLKSWLEALPVLAVSQTKIAPDAA